MEQPVKHMFVGGGGRKHRKKKGGYHTKSHEVRQAEVMRFLAGVYPKPLNMLSISTGVGYPSVEGARYSVRVLIRLGLAEAVPHENGMAGWYQYRATEAGVSAVQSGQFDGVNAQITHKRTGQPRVPRVRRTNNEMMIELVENMLKDYVWEMGASATDTVAFRGFLSWITNKQ